MDQLLDDNSADRRQLDVLSQQKRLLTRMQKSNAVHSQSLTKAIAVLRKTYDELKSVLSALDTADAMDAEDESLEVIRIARTADVAAAKCPFPASMVTDIPLLRLQAIESAEFDNALVSRPWTVAEDAQVTDAVRAAAQKAHYKVLLAYPQLSTNPHQEVASMTTHDALLLAEEIELGSQSESLYEGLDWEMVAIRTPTRNLEEIRTRWNGVLRPNVNSKPWSADEIAKLLDVGKSHLNSYLDHPHHESPVLWPKVAELVGTGRTPYACFVQFCAAIVKQDQPECTSTEDEKIKTLFNLFRGSWRIMSLHLTDTANMSLTPGSSARPATILGKVHRDPVHIYRQYRNRLDPALAKGKWTEQEDRWLLSAVQDLGSDNWASIAARIPGRTSSQCRERWQRRLQHTQAAPSADLLASRQRRINWSADLDKELEKYINLDLTPKDGMTWVQIAALLSATTGTYFTDKRVRDRIQTYRQWLKRTGSRDPAHNKPAKRTKETHSHSAIPTRHSQRALEK